ncbi:putative signal transducing protein [Flavimarina sp. Hel_I_48]|uniref:putative signal transducing protein n=1 Tax=Flavimarina sp. Hel_I_48 TaxID=1392488 RepID=UPI00068A7E70|nr:DUF2007 domain-containing protein [Flavimarina sp. Hel_I_48]
MKESDYEHVFTGSAIKANYLKNIFDEEGISAVVRNDHDSQLRAGFGGSYANQALIFVKRDESMRAKRIVERKMEGEEIPSEILEKQAAESRLDEEETVQKNHKRPLIKKDTKANRSLFNILLNVVLILYSLWRLMPLLQGEEISTWRILLSGFILVFCSITVFNHFRK